MLDEPYPDDLPVVPACRDCNAGFSPDEEYVACLVECMLAGSTASSKIGREKIARILAQRPALAARLAQAREETPDGVRFAIEDQRVRNVVLKLARGHALFDLNEAHREQPSRFEFLPLFAMSAPARELFERRPTASCFPEVGSRAMQRLVLSPEKQLPTIGPAPWIKIQPGRYRYLVSAGVGAIVRIVFSEYFASEVAWG
ncbi:MAG: hypothetical protein HY907_05980 [Deltaproteobacteria bacterium]|nr:hypothetical protein [Deltaproteobacteria bacterium]